MIMSGILKFLPASVASTISLAQTKALLFVEFFTRILQPVLGPLLDSLQTAYAVFEAQVWRPYLAAIVVPVYDIGARGAEQAASAVAIVVRRGWAFCANFWTTRVPAGVQNFGKTLVTEIPKQSWAFASKFRDRSGKTLQAVGRDPTSLFRDPAVFSDAIFVVGTLLFAIWFFRLIVNFFRRRWRARWRHQIAMKVVEERDAKLAILLKHWAAGRRRADSQSGAGGPGQGGGAVADNTPDAVNKSSGTSSSWGGSGGDHHARTSETVQLEPSTSPLKVGTQAGVGGDEGGGGGGYRVKNAVARRAGNSSEAAVAPDRSKSRDRPSPPLRAATAIQLTPKELNIVTQHNSVERIRKLLVRRDATVFEVTNAFSKQAVKRCGPEGLNCLTEETVLEALEEARTWDRRIERNPTILKDVQNYPLLGVPLSVKDSFLQKGTYTTCGGISCLVEQGVSQEDAILVRILREAGAIPIVRGNTCQLMLMAESQNDVGVLGRFLYFKWER